MKGTIHKSIKLPRARRWQLYLIGTGVWLTGALWLLFHYFLVTQGPFGPAENPATVWCLRLHGAFAFAAIWIFGLLWGAHITAAWPRRRRRASGAALTALFLLLILSGYLLYYVGDDAVRPVISVIHWSIGLAAPAFYLLHRIRRSRRARQTSTKQQSALTAQAK